MIISLVAIAAGFVVFYQMLKSQFSPLWTLVFLAFDAAHQPHRVHVSDREHSPQEIGFGIISLIALALSIYALYSQHLAGAWRWIYVVTALFALYLNVFVLVVQSFQKISALNALAPKGSEPPFAVAQAVVLLAFLYFGYRAVKTFRTRGA